MISGELNNGKTKCGVMRVTAISALRREIIVNGENKSNQSKTANNKINPENKINADSVNGAMQPETWWKTMRQIMTAIPGGAARLNGDRYAVCGVAIMQSRL